MSSTVTSGAREKRKRTRGSRSIGRHGRRTISQEQRVSTQRKDEAATAEMEAVLKAVGEQRNGDGHREE